MSTYVIDTEPELSAPVDADEMLVHDASAVATKRIGLDTLRTYMSNSIVDLTAATLTVTQALHAGKTITLNKADGIVITLPAASGTGNVYTFIVGTTLTSDGVVKVANASDAMIGYAIQGTDGTSVELLGADSGDDTITLNGSTTGGLVGCRVKVVDIATNVFHAEVLGETTGAEATPFSATVS